MRADTRDEADLKLVWRVLTEELETIKPWSDEWFPRRFHWILDADMLAMIKRLAAPTAGAEMLVGYPVEVRAGVRGIRLVEAVV